MLGVFFSGCELLENFDPLHQTSTSQVSTPSPLPPSVSRPDSDVELTVTNASPDPSPPLPRHKESPFHAPDASSNPFLTSDYRTGSQDNLADGIDKGLKHCISDTNLTKLKQEYKPAQTSGLMDTLYTRSEEDLTATTVGEELTPRHCIAAETQHQLRNVTPKASKKHTQDDDERLSKSLFFVKLDDWEVFEDSNDKPAPQAKVRSNETSPTPGRKGTSKYGSKHKLEFLNPSGIKPITSKANSRSPDLRRRGIGRSRDRSKSAAVMQGQAITKRSQWVSRYRPGVAVPIPGETARESIMQSELRHREKEFCSPVQLRWVWLWAGEGGGVGGERVLLTSAAEVGVALGWGGGERVLFYQCLFEVGVALSWGGGVY